MAALDINFQPGVNSTVGQPGSSRVLYLLGADEIDPKLVNKDSFVIYQVWFLVLVWVWVWRGVVCFKSTGLCRDITAMWAPTTQM